MAGRGNFLKENGGVPLDHPRRCQAHNRSAAAGKGEPCRRYAAKGAAVCTMHGGAAPEVRRKALLRRYVELDQSAQAEAAINVFLPQQLHPLVGGGGRGRRKAAKPTPAQPTLQPLGGIATGPRRGQPALVIDAEVIDAELVDADAEGGPDIGPNSSADAPRAPDRADLPGADSASSTAPVALPPPVSASYEDAPAVMRAARLRTDAARRTRPR